MKPLNKFIWIKQEEAAHYGGIIDPRSGDDKRAERAKVLAVGDEVTKVKKGDTIVFKSYNLFVIELNKKEFCFVTEEEVIATD